MASNGGEEVHLMYFCRWMCYVHVRMMSYLSSVTSPPGHESMQVIECLENLTNAEEQKACLAKTPSRYLLYTTGVRVPRGQCICIQATRRQGCANESVRKHAHGG